MPRKTFLCTPCLKNSFAVCLSKLEHKNSFNIIFFSLTLAFLRRAYFWPPLWSIFQSSIHKHYKLHFFMLYRINHMPEGRMHLELYIRIQIRTIQLLIFTEKFLPLPGFEPGTSPVPSLYMLPIELSWLGLKTLSI